jgi:hypothetical protein
MYHIKATNVKTKEIVFLFNGKNLTCGLVDYAFTKNKAEATEFSLDQLGYYTAKAQEYIEQLFNNPSKWQIEYEFSRMCWA